MKTTTMGQRLASALTYREMDPPELIAALHSSKGTVYNILNDTTKPEKVRDVTIAKICNILKINRKWLVFGKGNMDDPDTDVDPDWADVVGVRQAASLGPGAEPDEYAETHKLKFKASSLARKKLKPESLAVIYGKGDSMHPTIKDGDAILIDTSDKDPRDDKLFVVTYGRDLVAKRLLYLGDRWFIDSDNKSDPQWRKPKAIDETKGFEIHGRVRWVGSWED